MTEEHQGTEQPPPPCEANIFTTNPKGFSVHFKIISPYRGIVSNVETLLKALEALSYTPGTGPQAKSAAANAPPARQEGQQRAARPRGRKEPTPAPLCGESATDGSHEGCGGEVYDNRDDPKRGRGPHFRCKDKDCGMGGWENADGSIRWTYPRSN